eukprot:5924164-Pleurochrysis_carterae.AAC.1
MAVTSAPRRRSSDSGVDRAAPFPAKATSTWAARGAPRRRSPRRRRPVIRRRRRRRRCRRQRRRSR